jgi:hypothetical protein
MTWPRERSSNVASAARFNAAGADFLLDQARKPFTRIDTVDIPKDLLRAETVAQRVPWAARGQPVVPPPIADEDAAHFGPPPAPRLQINGADLPDIVQ